MQKRVAAAVVRGECWNGIHKIIVASRSRSYWVLLLTFQLVFKRPASILCENILSNQYLKGALLCFCSVENLVEFPVQVSKGATFHVTNVLLLLSGTYGCKRVEERTHMYVGVRAYPGK